MAQDIQLRTHCGLVRIMSGCGEIWSGHGFCIPVCSAAVPSFSGARVGICMFLFFDWRQVHNWYPGCHERGLAFYGSDECLYVVVYRVSGNDENRRFLPRAPRKRAAADSINWHVSLIR
jgi:hypothetical protein